MADNTNIFEHALGLLKHSVEQNEWDEIPMLSVMLDTGEEKNTLLLMAFADGHPADNMDSIARSIRTGEGTGDIFPVGKIMGVSLFNEAWIMGFENASAAAAYTAGLRRVSDSPTRQEAKVMLAFDGTTMQSWQFRRGHEGIEETPDAFDGRVPDALRNLYAAFSER